VCFRPASGTLSPDIGEVHDLQEQPEKEEKEEADTEVTGKRQIPGRDSADGTGEESSSSTPAVEHTFSRVNACGCAYVFSLA
jgi:hypothetical protein